jgi:hypothetical protein
VLFFISSNSFLLVTTSSSSFPPLAAFAATDRPALQLLLSERFVCSLREIPSLLLAQRGTSPFTRSRYVYLAVGDSSFSADKKSRPRYLLPSTFVSTGANMPRAAMSVKTLQRPLPKNTIHVMPNRVFYGFQNNYFVFAHIFFSKLFIPSPISLI